jgi:hypothetical protein
MFIYLNVYTKTQPPGPTPKLTLLFQDKRGAQRSKVDDDGHDCGDDVVCGDGDSDANWRWRRRWLWQC